MFKSCCFRIIFFTLVILPNLALTESKITPTGPGTNMCLRIIIDAKTAAQVEEDGSTFVTMPGPDPRFGETSREMNGDIIVYSFDFQPSVYAETLIRLSGIALPDGVRALLVYDPKLGEGHLIITMTHSDGRVIQIYIPVKISGSEDDFVLTPEFGGTSLSEPAEIVFYSPDLIEERRKKLDLDLGDTRIRFQWYPCDNGSAITEIDQDSESPESKEALKALQGLEEFAGLESFSYLMSLMSSEHC